MTHIADQPGAVFVPVDVVKRRSHHLEHRPSQLSRRLSSAWKEPRVRSAPHVPDGQLHGFFDGDDLAILRKAYLEAYAFFGHTIKPRQKAEIALSILSHARRGVRDPHRLALKAIVST